MVTHTCIRHVRGNELMLPKIKGLDAWKQDPKSDDYDWELIQTRLQQLRRVRETTDSQSAMIFALRTSLERNLGDMGNPKVSHNLLFVRFSFVNAFLASCTPIHASARRR